MIGWRGRKRPPLKVFLPLAAWDLAWRALAIRRAMQLGERKLIPGLLFANTLGLWPILYLWRRRGREAPVADVIDAAPQGA